MRSGAFELSGPQFGAATIVILIVVLIYCMPGFGQLKQAGHRWAQDKLVSMDQIDHQPFTQLLQKYVNANGEVNYSAWKKSVSDRKKLQGYLASLSRANPQSPSPPTSKLAFWINAYNAVTLEGILEVYPTTSIRKHTGLLGYNIWTDLKLVVGDRQINLEDIEHKVLRKMNEPRIHFAIVCASVGCPRLLNEAYRAENLEDQLTQNARDFFSRSRNLNYDARRNQIQLSAIMKWFRTDFGPDQRAQIRAVAKYFPESIQQVALRSDYSVAYLDYDWSLNDQKGGGGR